MTYRDRTRPDAAARALPMPTKSDEPGLEAATALGLPYMRLINGRPTLIRPGQES